MSFALSQRSDFGLRCITRTDQVTSNIQHELGSDDGTFGSGTG